MSDFANGLVDGDSARWLGVCALLFVTYWFLMMREAYPKVPASKLIWMGLVTPLLLAVFVFGSPVIFAATVKTMWRDMAKKYQGQED